MGLYISDFGAGIDEIEPFTVELNTIVKKMQTELVNETKILEGTHAPDYSPIDLGIPKLTEQEFLRMFGIENELSMSEETKEEWKSDSQNGSLTTDPIPISMQESSSSACIADLFNRACPTRQFKDVSSLSSTGSCSGNSADSGNETDAMNESSECMVQMINEQMDGMPNEER